MSGSLSRFASWVRPSRPAPSRKLWSGKGGSKPPAAPASIPTVSTPKPEMSRSLASHREASTSGPGVSGPFSPTFRNAVSSWARDLPAGAEQHPGAVGEPAVVGLPRLEVGDRQQVARCRPRSRRSCRSRTPARSGWLGPDRADVGAVLAGDPVDRRVEMRADVLADRQRVPGPGRAAVVVAADLLAASDPACWRTAAGA